MSGKGVVSIVATAERTLGPGTNTEEQAMVTFRGPSG